MTSPSASGEPQVSSDPARQIKWQPTVPVVKMNPVLAPVLVL
jgi:hypothetical protein